MKTIVIYKSKTGFTKKYAKWIQEELGCDIKDIEDIKNINLESYDRIIYGSSLMAGKIKGLDDFKKRVNNLGKEVFVFGVGLCSQTDASNIMERIRNDNLTTKEQETISLFYFEGGVDYDKLGFLQKKMLRMIYKSLSKKENRNQEEIGMMNALERSSDHTNKDNIVPLISICK